MIERGFGGSGGDGGEGGEGGSGALGKAAPALAGDGETTSWLALTLVVVAATVVPVVMAPVVVVAVVAVGCIFYRGVEVADLGQWRVQKLFPGTGAAGLGGRGGLSLTNRGQDGADGDYVEVAQ